MIRSGFLLAGLLLAACSGGSDSQDIPPLPEQTAETANALMAEAESASANAASRAETVPPSNGSDGETVNEVTP